MADIRIIPSTGLVNVTGSIDFTSGGSTMLFMTGSSRNVGIGTTGPAEKLAVVGNIRSAGNVIASVGLGYGNYISMRHDDVNGYITITRTVYAGNLILEPFGNVGIGTTSPAGKLDVRAGSGGKIILGSYDANYNVTVEGGDQLNFYNGASATTGYINYNGPGNILLSRNLYVEGNSSGGTTGAVRINSVGNVGIGSTSPGKALDVVGDIRASTTVSASSGLHIKSDGSADSSWDALTFRGTTEWGDTSAYGVLGGDAGEGIMIRRPHIVWSSVQSDAAIRLGRSGGTSSGDWFGVGAGSSNVFFIRRTTTTNSILEVDSNGNMALGAGSNYLYVRQGGNVGVGTTNPSNKFEVVGGVTATSFTGSLLGNASTATSATSATSASFASTAPYSGLTGTVPTWNQNTTGNAATATNATNAANINVSEKNDNVDYQVLFSTTNGTGNQSIFIDEDDSHLTYNPSTRTLSSATLVGALTGNASTATTATSASFASTAPYSGLTGTVPTWNQNTSGNAATATAVINTVTGTNSAELVRGNMADNDQFRILVGGTATNAGFVEIATADDGTEPIHVRQYTGVFSSLVRTATLLDGSGNTSFPGTLTAGNLSGTNTGDQTNITGNAGSVTNGVYTTGSQTIDGVKTFSELVATNPMINSAGTSNDNSVMQWRYGTNDAYRLRLKQTVTSGVVRWNFSQTNNNTDFNDVLVLDRGNVGIGTTSPISKFEVYDSANTNTVTITSDGANEQFRIRRYSNTNEQLIFGFHSSDYGYIQAVEQAVAYRPLSLNPNGGNVGIGTTSPSQVLHVVGYARANGFSVNDSSGTVSAFIGYEKNWIGSGTSATLAIAAESQKINFYAGGTTDVRMMVSSSGNVGINTTNPTEILDVRGVVRVSRSGVNDSGIIAFGNFLNGGGYYDNGIFRSALNAIGSSGNTLHMGSYEALAFTTSTNPLGSQSIRMYISGVTGNVGIGTTNPAAKLHVSGTADVFLAKGSGSASNTTIMAVDGNNGRLFEVSDDLSDSLFSVNTIAGLPVIEAFADYTVTMGSYNKSDLVVTGSKTGIGTPNPQRKLDVYDSGSQIVAQFSSSNASSVRIRFSDANTASENVNIGAIGTRMALWTNNTERLSILSGGNVGIGTTSPGAKLDVTGTGLFGNTTSGWYVSPSQLHVGGTGTAQISLEDVGLSTAAIALDGDNFAFGHQNSSPTYTFKYSNTYNGNYATTGTTFVQFNPTTNYINSGNVGIGTTAPTAKLYVKGNATDDVGLTVLENDHASGDQHYPALSVINTRGNHSYGVVAEFRINTAGDGDRPSILFYGEQAAHSWQIGQTTSTAVWGAADDFAIGYRASNDPTTFVNFPTAYLTVKTSGNVGIGTTSPGHKLDVKGDLNFSGSLNFAGVGVIGVLGQSSDVYINARVLYSNSTLNDGMYINYNSTSGGGAHLRFFANSTNERMRIDANSGNVGIGTTAPAAKLDVAGTLGFTAGAASAIIRRTTVNGSNGIVIQGNANDTVSDTNAGAYIYVGGGTLTDTYEGNIDFTAYGAIVDANRNQIRFFNRSGVNTVAERMRINHLGNIGIGTTSPTVKLHVSGGGVRIQGSGDPNNSLRFDDTGGTSRNAMFVSSSNYLVVGNTNYAGIQLIHTGSAPGSNNLDSGASRYYGTDQTYYLAEPNKWLAVRINSVDYVMPMYQV